MAESVGSRASDKRKHIWFFAGVAGFLLLLLGATTAYKTWRIADIKRHQDRIVNRILESAFGDISRDFTHVESEQMILAGRVATDPEVVERLTDPVRDEHTRFLAHWIGEIDLNEHTSVELYDQKFSLIAWNGSTMPFSEVPEIRRLPLKPATSMAIDKGVRLALVVWFPVKNGNRVIGAVRVMHLIAVNTPVQNQYLRNYALEKLWSRSTGLPVRLEVSGWVASTGRKAGEVSRILRAHTGETLGSVFIQSPAQEQLVAQTETFAGNLTAFWTTLLLAWILVGIWRQYRRQVYRLFFSTSQTNVTRSGWWLLGWSLAWWGMRYLLIALDVPARWQTGKTPFAPLFDPGHLASVFGYGLLRSTGDLVLSVLFFLVFSTVLFTHNARLASRGLWLARQTDRFADLPGRKRMVVISLTAIGYALIVCSCAYALASITNRIVMDSTLDYYARGGLIPGKSERLVVVVFGSLHLLTAGLLVLPAALFVAPLQVMVSAHWDRSSLRTAIFTAGLCFILSILAFLVSSDLPGLIPWPVFLFFIGLTTGIAIHRVRGRRTVLHLVTLRGTLLLIFVLSLLFYPIFYNGMDTRRRIHMESSLESFSEGRDPRVLFAVEQVLRLVQLEERLPTLFSENPSRPRSMAVDSLATEIVRGSLLYSLGPYDIGLTLLNTRGVPIGGYFETEQVLSRGEQVQADSILFDILHAMYGEQDSTGSLIEQITGRIERDRFQYVGLAPIGSMDNRSGWVMVRVEPQVLMSFSETPFPRVLLPSAFAGNLQSNLSLAEFRNGVLIRSLGRDFGRYRLSAAVSSTLLTKNDLWLDETIEGNDYLSFYRRHQPATPSYIQAPVLSSINPGVVGVRLPALNLFDHLYYLLRMVTAGLFFGVPAFLLGLWFRKRAGLIPARRIRFRDKVLNSFLGVGIVSMLAFGMVGSQVITGETENTISSWLRQHLERVEETLVLQARMDEMPYQVLARSQIDSLSSQVGLELNVYEGYHLVKSSRPQLVRDRLIDTRLPIEAYEALFFGDSRFVVSEGRMGTFAYKTGYRALLDEEGRPRYVLSVPTLPQQERIEEEQARTLAYLFGALLLLVLAVMLTASLVANALARPIARLRAGLEAVAMGNFERTIPVETRDEIGELVETFNSMQHQLAESRRILAQQERQLAWREMARQIAHEIKNPLTPMKLSVQHLRRAFDGLSISQAGQNDAAGNRFTGLFERITTTLVEQIDALARIANEFHSFARLPSRVLEQVDMNRVVQEAVALMQDDALIDIELATSDTPLIIEADREELRRIFINLIKNAIEAIPTHKDGRIWVRTLVDVSEDTGRAWAVSEVSDNGGGIPAELTDKIFQPNFSTKTSGTGLGLAISRKSVEDFGGEINFVTMEHEGTTFTIRIPLAVAAAGKG